MTASSFKIPPYPSLSQKLSSFLSLDLSVLISLSLLISLSGAKAEVLASVIFEVAWMDPSSAQHQDMATNASLESMLVCSKAQPERKPRPQPEQALKCPRCDSTNTKFCYYNNYSLSQPRYFCKSCRRYWTKGGTLRNVPVGGGCRKNKRSSSSSASKRPQDQPLSMSSSPNSNNPLSAYTSLGYDQSTIDLSLAFARLHNKQLLPEHFDHDHHLSLFGNSNTTTHHLNTATLDALGNTISGVNTSSGYFEQNPGGFPSNLYSYLGNGGEVESAGVSEEMGLHNYDQEMSCGATTTSTAVTVTTMKQEMCHSSARDEVDHQNRALWGFPWQNIISGGGDGNNLGDLELSGRESWNGLTSSWHGLLNSPLM